MPSLHKVKASLMSMRDRLQGQLSQSEKESVGALSSYDNHPADMATNTAARELDAGLAIGFEEQLHEVNRALEKWDEESYGICDNCGQKIDAGRLAVRPQSILCVSCQNATNDAHYIPTPDRDYVIPMPFGDRPDIHSGDVEADGEDMWQSVAQWGNSNTPQDTPPAIDYHETFVGFAEPIGFVEEIESIVDENGDVLWDALREKERREGRSIMKESDEYPD